MLNVIRFALMVWKPTIRRVFHQGQFVWRLDTRSATAIYASWEAAVFGVALYYRQKKQFEWVR